MTRYFANVARDRPRVAPGELPSAIGVLIDRDDPMPRGIAYPAGHVGGRDWRTGEERGPREAVWRLVVGEHEVDGRFALRSGVFVELAEDAG